MINSNLEMWLNDAMSYEFIVFVKNNGMVEMCVFCWWEMNGCAPAHNDNLHR